eukprot:XP_001705143.1 Hypothetical protein GL50803_29061 [Giardia lamblia ATCC 50803]
MPLPVLDSYHVERLCARVVCAIDHRPDRETARDAELVANASGPATLRRHLLDPSLGNE